MFSVSQRVSSAAGRRLVAPESPARRRRSAAVRASSYTPRLYEERTASTRADWYAGSVVIAMWSRCSRVRRRWLLLSHCSPPARRWRPGSRPLRAPTSRHPTGAGDPQPGDQSAGVAAVEPERPPDRPLVVVVTVDPDPFCSCLDPVEGARRDRLGDHATLVRDDGLRVVRHHDQLDLSAADVREFDAAVLPRPGRGRGRSPRRPRDSIPGGVVMDEGRFVAAPAAAALRVLASRER